MNHNLNRRTLLRGVGGALSLPLLESMAAANNPAPNAPTRFLVVGNPFGAHPEHFFPKEFGNDVELPATLRSLDWLKDRLTVVSHTDHGMVSGHGREVSFLSGVLPSEAQVFPEKNLSLDQLFARHIGSQVRYDSVGASLDSGIRMSWTANGVEKLPITNPQDLFDHLFLNLTDQQKTERRQLLARDGSILDTVGSRFDGILKRSSHHDRQRIDQFQTSVRELEVTLKDRAAWLTKDKPTFDLAPYFKGGSSIENRYDAIFDMIGYAFETDLTRVASIEFPSELKYTEIDGVNRSYHGCTHNGKQEKRDVRAGGDRVFSGRSAGSLLEETGLDPRARDRRHLARPHDRALRQRNGLRRDALQPQPADPGRRWRLPTSRSRRCQGRQREQHATVQPVRHTDAAIRD